MSKRTKKYYVFLSFLFYILLLAGQASAAVLKKIDVALTDENSTEVLLNFDEKVRYQIKMLQKTEELPYRCYIDLFNVALYQPESHDKLPENPYISKIRTGKDPGRLRVVLDLKDDFECIDTTSLDNKFYVKISVKDSTSHVDERLNPNQPQSIDRLQIESQYSSDKSSPIIENDTKLVKSDNSTSSKMSDFSYWGWLKLYAAYDTNSELYEDNSLYRARGRLGIDWDNKAANFENSFEALASVDVDRIFYDADEADEDTEFTLNETYLQFNRPRWDISIGKQRVRWGKSDQLSPVDTINPQDFRQFVTVDLEERSMPSWMLRHRWYGDSMGLELIAQPWFEKSEIEYFDSNWAIYRKLRQAILENPAAPTGLKSYARNLYVDDDKPSKNISNMSAAVRFKWNTSETDFAVSYHHGWETLPTITNFPVKNISFSGDPDINLERLLEDTIVTGETITAKYKRQQVFGFEWETVAFDPIGFRGEIAHLDKVAFLNSTLTSTRRQVTHLVSGFDYTFENEWYFNIQGSLQHIHDYSDEILYFDDDTLAVLGEIRKPLWRGNLELATKFFYTITDQSSFLQPSATLKYFRNIECELGANIFSGDGDTLFGSYDQDDQIYGLVKYSF